ncbi:MAG: anaerobic ribonucleoside-triphosphate reductase [Candidatus Asgardarchaeia archaeon]
MSDNSKESKKFEKILSTFSSPVRVKIILALTRHKYLSFSSILHLTSSYIKKSSNLAYHLKFLVSSGLISYDKHRKAYTLTPLGTFVSSFLSYLNSRVSGTNEPLVLNLKKNLLIPLSSYFKERISEYNLPSDMNVSLEFLKELEKLNNPVISAEIADILFFYKLLSKKNLSSEKISFFILKNKLQYIDTFNRSILLSSGYKSLLSFFLDSLKESFLFNVIKSNTMFMSFLKQGYLFIDKQSHFIFPKYYFIYGSNLTTFFKSDLERVNGLAHFLNNFMLLSASYPYNIMYITIDNLNYYLSKNSGEYTEYDLKMVFLNFFKRLSSFNYLFPNISIELNILSKHYIERKLPYTLKDLYNEYYDEIIRITKAFLESYILRQKEWPSLNPHISIKLDEKSLDNPMHFEIIKIISDVPSSIPLNISFSNASVEWHDKFIYGYDGELYEFNTLYNNKGINGIVGVNLFSLAKASSYDESLLKEKLQDVVHSTISFLQMIDEKVNNIFPSRILTYYPLSSKPQKTYSISLIGLNECIKSITGSYPWSDDTSLKILHDLITFTEVLVNESSTSIPVNITNVYPFLDFMDIRSNMKIGQILSSSTSIYHGNISFRKVIHVESLLHPHLRGGHRLILRFATKKNYTHLFGVLNQLLKSSVGSFTFSFPSTYCELCSSWYAGTPHICRRCGTNDYLKAVINLHGVWEKVDNRVKNKLKMGKGYNKPLI